MKKRGKGGSIIYMGSVHSKEASPLKSAYVTAKHGLIGLAKTVAKEGSRHGIRANVICPGFVRTPLVDKQIPEQARALGISEDDVIRKVMLGETVDGQFTALEDVAEVALLFAAIPSNVLTGQSLIVNHGWSMQQRSSASVDAAALATIAMSFECQMAACDLELAFAIKCIARSWLGCSEAMDGPKKEHRQ